MCDDHMEHSISVGTEALTTYLLFYMWYNTEKVCTFIFLFQYGYTSLHEHEMLI